MNFFFKIRLLEIGILRINRILRRIRKPSKDLKKIWLKKSFQNSLNTFWYKSKHEVESPYDKKFREQGYSH